MDHKGPRKGRRYWSPESDRFRRTPLLKPEVDNEPPRPPDMDDQFKPDLTSDREMRCLHCGKIFPEKSVIWAKRLDLWLWWCPNPRCDGAGVGFDIYPSDHKIFKRSSSP
jgi:hypothetical protein